MPTNANNPRLLAAPVLLLRHRSQASGDTTSNCCLCCCCLCALVVGAQAPGGTRPPAPDNAQEQIVLTNHIDSGRQTLREISDSGGLRNHVFRSPTTRLVKASTIELLFLLLVLALLLVLLALLLVLLLVLLSLCKKQRLPNQQS